MDSTKPLTLPTMELGASQLKTYAYAFMAFILHCIRSNEKPRTSNRALGCLEIKSTTPIID